MSQFFAVIALMLCFVPACFAVLFASRNPLFLIWNLGWFWIMGHLGETAVASPQGRLIGLVFSALYVWRALNNSNRSQVFFSNLTGGRAATFTRGANPFATPKNTPSTETDATVESPRNASKDSPKGEPLTIEAEFHEIDNSSH